MQQASTGQNGGGYLTYAELEQHIGVKTGTLYSWVSRRVIPFVRVGPRVVRFRRTEIDAWLEEHSVRPDETVR